jgi:protease I
VANELQGKRIAFLATNGVEDSELREPHKAVTEAGADADVVSLEEGEIEGKKGSAFQVDKVVTDVEASDYDALVLPGGVANPDKLRTDDKAVRFVREFFEEGKPVGVICHGGWTLVEADVVRGRKMTSYPSIKTDLVNAGAKWVDEEVVVDRGLVSSRWPDDLPAFNAKLIEEIAEGIHEADVRAGFAGPQRVGAGHAPPAKGR